MQNTPRIYIDQNIDTGNIVNIAKETAHYLHHVMRRTDCLVFNNGKEYKAELTSDDKNIVVKEKTGHEDPSNNVILFFAPIKRTDELLNMVTQLGVCAFQPVITDRTVANHINWPRMQKILIEASEQSNRNSVPKLLEPIKFDDVDFSDVIIADERFAHEQKSSDSVCKTNKVFIGPEGGFSQKEFDKMDSLHVQGIDLGKTILRAEVAGVVAVSKVLKV